MKTQIWRVQMDKLGLFAITVRALPVLALGLLATDASAEPVFGTNVDNFCNPIKPYTNYSSYGVSRCNLCHNANNRSIYVSPEWDWYRNGATVPPPEPDKSDWNNFCNVQGMIASPANNGTYSLGAKVDLSARGFSPSGKTKPLTYTFSFSDGRPDIVVKPSLDNYATYPLDNSITVKDVPLNTAGSLTVTLVTKDSTDQKNSVPSQINLTVSNTPTVGNADTYSINAGQTLSQSAPGVLANDTGTAPLKAVLGTNVAHGSLSLSNTGAFSYTPSPSYAGTDSFTYTATNGVLTSSPATVTINVNAVVPTANADSYSVQSNTPLQIVAPGVLANDLGAGTLTAVLGTNVTKGSLTLNANGGFSYTPNQNFTGTDSFTYKAHNAVGDSAPATVTLDVGSCTDKDKDGYSPEGGRCGPVDCNDKQANVSPGLKEICTNKIDDDCNGLADNSDPACPLYSGASPDCLSAKLAGQVNIDSAEWKNGKLTVRGSKAKVGSLVTVSDAVSSVQLGTTNVVGNGSWKLDANVPSSTNAACRVKAVIEGAVGSKVVNGTTANCSSNNGAPPLGCNQ